MTGSSWRTQRFILRSRWEKKSKGLLWDLSDSAFGWFRYMIHSHTFWSLGSFTLKNSWGSQKAFVHVVYIYQCLFTKLEIKAEYFKKCTDLSKDNSNKPNTHNMNRFYFSPQQKRWETCIVLYFYNLFNALLTRRQLDSQSQVEIRGKSYFPEKVVREECSNRLFLWVWIFFDTTSKLSK